MSAEIKKAMSVQDYRKDSKINILMKSTQVMKMVHKKKFNTKKSKEKDKEMKIMSKNKNKKEHNFDKCPFEVIDAIEKNHEQAGTNSNRMLLIL